MDMHIRFGYEIAEDFIRVLRVTRLRQIIIDRITWDMNSARETFTQAINVLVDLSDDEEKSLFADFQRRTIVKLLFELENLNSELGYLMAYRDQGEEQ